MSRTFFNLLFIGISLFFVSCSKDKNENNITETDDIAEVVTDTTINKTKLFWLYLHHEEIPGTLIETEAPRRDLIVMNAWFHEYVQKFKAVNPEIKTLVYKDLTSTRSYAVENGEDNKYLPTGVGFQYADTNHPEWFLLDTNENRLEYTGYPDHWQMDIGNTEYQQQWANQVGEELVTNDWDGVLMDNAIYTLDTYHENVFPKNYETNTEFQLAYKSMLTTINTRLKTDNKIGIANITNTRLYPGVWESYMQHLDGGLDEWWLVFSNGNYLSDYTEGFVPQINEVVTNEVENKITLVQPHSSTSDNQGFYYAFASYWLVNDGNTYFSEQEVTDAYNEPSPWREEYTWNFGKADNTYFQVESGVYRRNFSHAIVLVNANETGAVEVNLDAPYLNEMGEEVISIMLNGLNGSVLRKVYEE
ncbi:putative glycoside hydrolase [Zobellia nedashkovskayae]|uniref:putative glycoside hydrolase n=1 Tax=Zobellia nedashkovskayae TaxID=2779510 RepID=UPI00188D1460|nr:putative glycoside hydrolase [Zobellia nedashkovskayae]